MSDDRIAKLSQRFSRHTVGRTAGSNRTRERRSFYLDADLAQRIDQVYRDLNHEIYPQTVSKSVFLETVIEHGLEHLDELKATLRAASDGKASRGAS